MLILYTLEGCPYCQKVKTFFDEMGLSYQEKEITDADHERELLDRGGNKQVPYLYDTDTETGIYESEDIIRHAQENYIDLVGEEEVAEEEISGDEMGEEEFNDTKQE